MSRSLNRVTLIGNVGKDPFVRKTGKGDTVATFPLATSETWRDKKQQMQERTDWHNVVAFRKLAAIVEEIVQKGSRLFIEGKLQSRSFESNGQTRFVTEIVAETMICLDSKSKESNHSNGDSRSENSPESITSWQLNKQDDDLPF